MLKVIVNYNLEALSSISVTARYAKLTNSMLVINITTPLEKYDKVVGRFGISDVEKHVVAEIVYPQGCVGTELLFNVRSIAEFDAKFSLATPIEPFQRVLVVGKLKPEQVRRMELVVFANFNVKMRFFIFMTICNKLSSNQVNCIRRLISLPTSSITFRSFVGSHSKVNKIYCTLSSPHRILDAFYM